MMTIPRHMCARGQVVASPRVRGMPSSRHRNVNHKDARLPACFDTMLQTRVRLLLRRDSVRMLRRDSMLQLDSQTRLHLCCARAATRWVRMLRRARRAAAARWPRALGLCTARMYGRQGARPCRDHLRPNSKPCRRREALGLQQPCRRREAPASHRAWPPLVHFLITAEVNQLLSARE